MAYYPAIGTTDVSGIVDSLNTTEQTPRNIADVLAEELARIAGNILPPNASQIAYDNTESGLTATNVQDAIDEVISSQADVIADTMADLTKNKTATVTDGVADFETIDGSLVKSLVVEVEPSATGFTQADVFVVGKNWGNPISYRVHQGVTYNPLSDGSISVQGTATDYSFSQSIFTLKAGNYLVCNDANVSNTAQLQIRRNSDDQILLAVNYGQHRALSLESDTEIKFRLVVNTGNTIDAIIYPMIVLSTETDLSFEPYKGKTYTTNFGQSITAGGTLDFLTGKLTTGGQTIQLTPQKVKSLVGENHILASTGEVLECKFSMVINGDDLAQIIGG